MASIRSPHVVGYLGHYTLGGELYIVMERCDEDLARFTRRLRTLTLQPWRIYHSIMDMYVAVEESLN